MLIWRSVKIGFSEPGLLLPPTCCSVSIIGSGEAGAELGDRGEEGGEEGDGGPRNCFLFFSRFISSLKLLAICSGVRGVSLKGEGLLGGKLLELAPPCCFSGVQCMGTHRLLLVGLLGEWSGSKSMDLFSVTQAMVGLVGVRS